MPLLSPSWFGVGLAVMVATYTIAKGWVALTRQRRRVRPTWWVVTRPMRTYDSLSAKSMVIEVCSRRASYTIDTVPLDDPDLEDKVIAAQAMGTEKVATLTGLTS